MPIPTMASTEEKANIKPKNEEEIPSKNVVKTEISEDIDPNNEVQDMKLVLIHLVICLCTFLVGSVSSL